MRIAITLIALVLGTALASGRASAADCTSATAGDRVYYVTDRAALPSDQLYSGERGLTPARTSIVTYGTIAAPASAKTIVRCASRTTFLRALAKRFVGPKRRVLVYVHGYYTTFRRAVNDALAMQKILRFAGPVIVYSWPSKVTSRLAYVNDENNATWSLYDFAPLLDDVLQTYPAASVSFAAHSLGGRFATTGIDLIRRTCAACVGPAVFFAPDVDADTFRAGLAAAGRCQGRPAEKPTIAAPVTLYVSNKDLALRQSQKIHGHQRAGQAGSEIVLCGGVDTIDVGYLKFADKTGHSYQIDATVVADASAAFVGTAPTSPSRRLTRAKRPGGVYYEIRR